jgi:hypothetical protein
VDRELEKLEEYSKPYCLCRKAYDEQIPMLECDQCGEWYHFGCVGLRTPGGPEEGDEVAVVPDRFVCPMCCLRSGTKYSFYHRLPRLSISALENAAAAMPPPPSGAAQQISQPQIQAAAAQMAQMATMFSPQWQQYALAAAQLSRGGSMMSPQAVMQSMMEAQAQAQAQAHMMMQQGAMGYNPYGMFAGHMHPALAQAYQAQAAAVAAVAAQQQQQQQPKETQEDEAEIRPTKKQRNDEEGTLEEDVPAVEDEAEAAFDDQATDPNLGRAVEDG